MLKALKYSDTQHNIIPGVVYLCLIDFEAVCHANFD